MTESGFRLSVAIIVHSAYLLVDSLMINGTCIHVYYRPVYHDY